MQKNSNNYEVNNVSISSILNWIDSGEIGLPELQRPFVWPTKKVRNLIDSLYRGYPIGYIVTWNSPSVKLKNGTSASGKKVIIDGQQRITALRAAIAGEPVLTKKFEEIRIKIAFNPLKEEFQTLNPAIAKDSIWIDDISEIISNTFFSYDFYSDYFAKNPSLNDEDKRKVQQSIAKLMQLQNCSVGNIVLGSNLSINDVTEIFNRINSAGTTLSSADFVMSKLSADEAHHGNEIRKIIDYFCQILHQPDLHKNIENVDPEFTSSLSYDKIKWVINDHVQIYRPTFNDLLHVMLETKFQRGQLSAMVSLVSGRNFKTREYDEESLEDTYSTLYDAAFLVTNKVNFENYEMILQSMGMIDHQILVLKSYGNLDFGYALYLYLKNNTNLSEQEIEQLVKKWIVMSALIGRYSGSSETHAEMDIKMIADNKDHVKETIESVLNQNLTDDFWNVNCINALRGTSTQSSVWRLFLMAQVRDNTVGWLENDQTVRSMITGNGNIHHIFPKAYMRKNGFSEREYSRVANYTWLNQPRNIQIGDRAPKDYLNDDQVISYATDKSFEENAIPTMLRNATFEDYHEFIEERVKLMANKIRKYYESL